MHQQRLLDVHMLFFGFEADKKELLSEINKIPDGSIMMMENIRFYEEERKEQIKQESVKVLEPE